MEIIHLKEFLAMSEFCNYTAAAETMFVSQPTLYRHIKTLEAELGVLLFERHGKKIVLSRFGEQLVPHARRAVEEMEEYSRQLTAELSGSSSTLKIASNYYINDLICNFFEANHKYTNGKLKEYAFFCKNNPNEANYKKLCWYIDFLYDQYCFALSIKIRSAYYRIKRKQYINLLHYILLFVLFILSYFRTPLVTWISIYLLLSIANSYGKHIELFLLLILIVLIRAFIQLLWDSLTGYHSAKDDRMLP